MATPTRHSDSKQIVRTSRTFFVTTKTSKGRALLQSDRNAKLFIDVLRSYVAGKKFKVHDFVVMPDHVHLLVTVSGEMSIENAVQFIKGGFSYRLRKGTGYRRRGLAKGLFRSAGQRRRQFREASEIHCSRIP